MPLDLVQDAGDAFDTLDAAKTSLRRLVGGGRNRLLSVLQADGEDRMPPDAPIDEQDIALVQQWIDDGAQGL